MGCVERSESVEKDSAVGGVDEEEGFGECGGCGTSYRGGTVRQEPVAYENQLAGQRRKVGPSQPRGVRGTRPGYRGVEGFRSRKAGGMGAGRYANRWRGKKTHSGWIYVK